MRFKSIVAFLLFFLLASSCSNDEEAPQLTLFQETAIDYLEDVALGFESGGSQIVRKWFGSYRLFVDGNPSPEISQELEAFVEELNSILGGNLEVRFVDDEVSSNATLLFGPLQDFRSANPDITGVSSNNFGFFWINARFGRIEGARLWVDNQRPSFDQMLSTMKEEVVQSLGFGRDSPRYPESIFYETANDGGFATELSDLDREIIRLLYHPDVRLGMTAVQVREAITLIYQEENSN